MLMMILMLLLLLLLLLLDLNVICFFEEGIFPLRSIHVLGLVQFGILIQLFVLVIHLHLVWIITCHGSVHISIHLLVHLDMVSILLVDLPTLELALNPRLTESGDEDAAAATTFLVYMKYQSKLSNLIETELINFNFESGQVLT